MHLNFSAEDGLLKADFHTRFHVASPGLLPALLLAAAKKAAKNVTQSQIAKVKVDLFRLGTTKSTEDRSRVGTNAGMAELVIALAIGVVL